MCSLNKSRPHHYQCLQKSQLLVQVINKNMLVHTINSMSITNRPIIFQPIACFFCLIMLKHPCVETLKFVSGRYRQTSPVDSMPWWMQGYRDFIEQQLNGVCPSKLLLQRKIFRFRFYTTLQQWETEKLGNKIFVGEILTMSGNFVQICKRDGLLCSIWIKGIEIIFVGCIVQQQKAKCFCINNLVFNYYLQTPS